MVITTKRDSMFGFVDAIDGLGQGEVSTVFDLAWRGVTVVVSTLAMLAETMEVLHSQL